MTNYRNSDIQPVLIRLDDYKFTAIYSIGEDNRKYFIHDLSEVLASVTMDLEYCEDYANGEVVYLCNNGEERNMSFADYFDSLSDNIQTEILIAFFLEEIAKTYPKHPISILEFLKLDSIQQQQYIDHAVSTPYMKFRWIWEFSNFAKGKSNYFAPVWGAKMLKVGRLFRKCIDADQIEKNTIERIEKNIKSYKKTAA